MVSHFIDTCKKQGDKIAFIKGNKHVSYQTLLLDVYRMVNCFIARGVARGESVLLYVLPSYDFYVLLLASIYYGVNIVTPDLYKDRARLSLIMRQAGACA